MSVLEIISQGIEIEYVTWLIVWVFSFVVFEVFMNVSLGAFFRVIRVCRVIFCYVTTSQIKVAKTLDTTYIFRVNRVCRVAFGYVTISQIKVAKSCQNTRQYTMKLCEKHFLGIMTQIANEL